MDTDTTTATVTAAKLSLADAAGIDYDQLEAELQALKREYIDLRKKTNKTIDSGVGRADDLKIKTLKQKIGLPAT